MASGFCLRVLLLPLIIYGQLALGNVFRYGSQMRPHPEQTRSSLWTYDPVRSNHDGSLHPRASQNLKFPDVSKTSETITRQRPNHFSGQVDSYSPGGSVSSYKPASFQSSVKQMPRSSSYQNEPRMWETKSQSDRKGSNVVSSGAIVMQFAPPPQQQSSEGSAGLWDDSSSVYSPGMSYTGKLPLNHPAFSTPAVLPSKEGMWGSVSASRAHTHLGELPLTHPAFSAPAVLQSKEGMWGSVSHAHTRPGELPLTHPAFSAPAVLQSKEGMWGSVSHAHTRPGELPLTHPAFSAPAVLQSKEGMWDSVFASKPRHPVFSAPAAPQFKAGTLDGISSSSAQSFKPHQSPNPAPPVQQGKSSKWNVPASNLQSPRMSNIAKLPLTHPAFPAPAGMQDGVYSSKAQSPNPRSFRPEAHGSYTLKQQPRMMGKPQPVYSFPQSNRGDFGDKAQVKRSPRSLKPVPVSSRSVQWQHQPNRRNQP